jgi:hypothetical protein
MWNFIKNLYFKLRNSIAITYVKAIDYSMELANKARTIAHAAGGSTFKSFMFYVASFAVFCVSYLAFKVMIALIFTGTATLLALVLGETLAILASFVLLVVFVVDLIETIEFLARISRTLRHAFGGTTVYA